MLEIVNAVTKATLRLQQIALQRECVSITECRSSSSRASTKCRDASSATSTTSGHHVDSHVDA